MTLQYILCFKQKTAYDMRISDWSSDVCSSDLVGSANKKLKVGDRVVVPFTIVCGECDQCRRGNFSVCERTNRNKDIADKVFGHTTAGLYGYKIGRASRRERVCQYV